MFLSEFILLAITFSTAWIYLKSSEEIYCLLCAIIASICSLVGLALAPWPIQLSIVMLLLCLDKLNITKSYH